MEKKKKALSLRTIIMLVFICSLFVSVSCYGALVFANWTSSARKTTAHIAADVAEEIYRHVCSYIEVPYQINKLNHKILENGILDLSDEDARDRFFAGVVDTHGARIYSFSYGTENGEYYGARINENGAIEIMRSSAETGGRPQYFSVNEDLTAGKLVFEAGQFDPRTRAWYKSAVAAGGPEFAPLYKHFVVDDLAVSAGWPIFDEAGRLSGVLGTHMLISDIGAFLQDAVAEYGGLAMIFEQASDDIVASSTGKSVFSLRQGGFLERINLRDAGSSDIELAYRQYATDGDLLQIVHGSEGSVIVNFRELHMNGIDWVIASAIPASIFTTDISNSMRWAAVVATAALLLSVYTFRMLLNKHFKPIKRLLEVSAEFSSGDLSKRVDIVREDEIGMISQRFNSVADKMQALIENLESHVEARTKDLKLANAAVTESQEQLRLILDSAAEAIYGIDLDGNCTFCNRRCIEMLGYSEPADLLGKNMHQAIHHSLRDGTPLPIDDCRILKALKNDEGSHVEDEVFWRADGTCFDVEYFSYPQIENGAITGAVITFMDISERKQKEAEIQYLYCYDTLTGQHNRRCFEENRGKIDIADNLPLSVIFADVNGLKMINDIFGHAAGDELIRKSADILQQVCRPNDKIARIGGDEFVIMLPNTTRDDAKKRLEKIRSASAGVLVKAINCSLSLGFDTKISPDQSLDEIMANAENYMYKDKTMNRMTINKDIVDTIIATLHEKNQQEKEHSETVSKLCFNLGNELGLSTDEVCKLKRAGYLHDVGKIVMPEHVLVKHDLSDDEREVMKQHPATGYRILSLFDDTLRLAEYVYSHHERWDGTGYPLGLEGEKIPLLSRIISVAEVYDRVQNRGELPLHQRKQAALEVIENGAGTQFDPHIADLFVRLMTKGEEKQT